ncbi:MAG: ribosome silencing factor [Chloroflexi bacterium]|nr:MAG: ribosome silencing factor [Chloroflexota bacterium]MBL1195927.1 ribosome silencing factor [Chloroflexota bacterium]NOH13220.1 ribosome silencing factor [Chloroflexota bacterium]
MEALDLARSVVEALEDRKAENIVLLDIRDVAIFADYFVICSGTSNRMLRALTDAARDKAKEAQDKRILVEGEPQDGWLLADFGDVVLHVFSEDQREFYKLEELWSEGKVLLHVQ